ncbi:F-box containing protein [Kurlavirus BKC-1]|nr:F-box containing protein [Kurlavirus BKC-1]
MHNYRAQKTHWCLVARRNHPCFTSNFGRIEMEKQKDITIFVMETLPNGLVLHILSFCGASDVCSFSRTMKEHLLLANGEMLWKQLCKKSPFPMRKKCDSWREWFIRMSKREPVAYTIEWKLGKDGIKREILAERNNTIKELLFEIATEHCIAPHTLNACNFAKCRKVYETPLLHGQVPEVFVERKDI